MFDTSGVAIVGVLLIEDGLMETIFGAVVTLLVESISLPDDEARILGNLLVLLFIIDCNVRLVAPPATTLIIPPGADVLVVTGANILDDEMEFVFELTTGIPVRLEFVSAITCVVIAEFVVERTNGSEAAFFRVADSKLFRLTIDWFLLGDTNVEESLPRGVSVSFVVKEELVLVLFPGRIT
jgi:hypothetical protein